MILSSIALNADGLSVCTTSDSVGISIGTPTATPGAWAAGSPCRAPRRWRSSARCGRGCPREAAGPSTCCSFISKTSAGGLARPGRRFDSFTRAMNLVHIPLASSDATRNPCTSAGMGGSSLMVNVGPSRNARTALAGARRHGADDGHDGVVLDAHLQLDPLQSGQAHGHRRGRHAGAGAPCRGSRSQMVRGRCRSCAGRAGRVAGGVLGLAVDRREHGSRTSLAVRIRSSPSDQMTGPVG